MDHQRKSSVKPSANSEWIAQNPDLLTGAEPTVIWCAFAWGILIAFIEMFAFKILYIVELVGEQKMSTTVWPPVLAHWS